MEEALEHLAEYVALAVNMVAILGIALGSLEAIWGLTRLVIRNSTATEKSEVWMRFAGWLIVALTFQLAADIVETSITTSWDALGRIAVIAVIRTFLNYFLNRDVTDARERAGERAAG